MTCIQGVVAVRFSAMAFAFLISACASIPPDSTDTPSADEHTGQATQALTGTHKVCSAINTGAPFRDSIEVDDGWSATTCLGWVQSVGGTQWQLGCLSTNGFSWGATNGGIPTNPSCGW
jgi:hypothetical protein